MYKVIPLVMTALLTAGFTQPESDVDKCLTAKPNQIGDMTQDKKLTPKLKTHFEPDFRIECMKAAAGTK